MPSCFVKGCKSYAGTIKQGQGRRSSFHPTTDEILEKWRTAIPWGDCLEKKHVICDLHFSEEHIINNYVEHCSPLLTPNMYIQPVRFRLKKGAVPSIFECTEKYINSMDEEVKNILKNSKVLTNIPQRDPLDTMFLEENIFKIIAEKSKMIPVPSPYWAVNDSGVGVVWNCWSVDYLYSSHKVLLHSDMSVNIYVKSREIHIGSLKSVKNVSEIIDLLEKVSKLLPCFKEDVARSVDCIGYVMQKDVQKKGPQIQICQSCRKFRRKVVLEKNINITRKNKILQKKVKKCKQRTKRISRKITRLKNKIETLKSQCAEIREEALNDCFAKLPEKQQQAVKAIISASKIKNPKGMRYQSQWVYECLLLRIKSCKAYEHLRKNKILALPCLKTLNTYMKFMKSQYGFQESVFKGIKIKTDSMLPQDAHGCLLLDEMKLTKALSFNKLNLKFEGFTDLGSHTPEHQKGKPGDHALVLMFQPFKGKWVQTLGCFLSKGSASGTVLHKLIMECIILAENAGLKIDAVVTDGATWNRKMWDIFGVTDEVVSIPHLLDVNRRLWFISDFPHLIKCIRNFLIKHGLIDGIWTPDGLILLIFWYALLEVEDPESYGIKCNFKLKKDHLEPKFFQKMNVKLAFQFFGVADVLELFKNRHPELEECDPAIQFCKRWKSLKTAMNSRTPMEAMKPENEYYKIVQNFISYLEEWESVATEKGYDFISDSSFYGLKVSLKATMEICNYLINECGFSYLMTARLNQDNLERFFGMMRDCCGANDHPDSNLFIQVYRLVSTYSLVQPPKGSNISSHQIFDVLLNIKDIDDETERREQWEAQLDTILDNGCNSNLLTETVKVVKDHNYFESENSKHANAYISGYVARKVSTRFAKFFVHKKPSICNDCIADVVLQSSDVIPEEHKLILIRSKGFLKHPFLKLSNLINILEAAVMGVVGRGDIDSDTLFHVTEALSELSLPFVGCKLHSELLTRRITNFFLTTRMLFISKQWNSNNNERKITREKRKLAKLSTDTLYDVSQEPEITMKKKREKSRLRLVIILVIEIKILSTAPPKIKSKEKKML